MLQKKQKLYYFCDKSLTYKEAKGPGWRNIIFFAAGFLGILMIGFVADYFTGNYVGNLFYNFVRSERKNMILSKNLYKLKTKVDSLEKQVDNLSVHDKNLRLTVNLPILADEVKEVGIGGKSYNPYSESIDEYLDTDIDNFTSIVDKLSRQVKLQKQSYEEILNKYKNDKTFFECVPALKPMEGTYDLNSFGMRLHPILGFSRMHEGVDIIAPENTPVHSSGNGVVEFVGNQGSFGLLIIINHGHGYQSYYGHLNSATVRINNEVKRGQLIAYSGNSGLSTGPHLHYEVAYNNKKLDPVRFFVDDISNIVKMSLAKH
jgi:murein DD-endopeptidase MepM/ murein hydrolase activator NlpD